LWQLALTEKMHEDDKTYARLYGYAPKGGQAEVGNLFVRNKLFTTVGTIGLHRGIIASKVVEGLLTREEYKAYSEEDVVCLPLTLSPVY
jgi:hypothetical protein